MVREDFQKLKNFAENLGYRVIDSDCDSWHHGSRIISNNSNRTPENRIIYLAHECGHAQVYESHKLEYDEMFPGFKQGGKNYKVSELEQEVLAWNEGLSILRGLGISFNMNKFSKIKTMCLRGYL